MATKQGWRSALGSDLSGGAPVKVIKRGSTGPAVRKWQTFLRGQGFGIQITGQFDAETEASTSNYQRQHRLDVDGVVGNQTLGHAGTLGMELVDYVSDANSGYPREPRFAALMSTADRQRVFGKFAFTPAPTARDPEAIRITDNWPSENIITIQVPEWVGVTGFPVNGKISFHRHAAPRFRSFVAAVQAAGMRNQVLSWGGSFVPRFIRGSRTTLSNHAFGTAFDINMEWNALGAEPAWPGHKGCVFELVRLAHLHGFYWGGHFKRRRDGMHFELAEV